METAQSGCQSCIDKSLEDFIKEQKSAVYSVGGGDLRLTIKEEKALGGEWKATVPLGEFPQQKLTLP